MIEQVFFSTGKQHHDLKKRTMEKMLENTLKAEINTNYRLVMTKESSLMMTTQNLKDFSKTHEPRSKGAYN
jgi:hypothetical protein